MAKIQDIDIPYLEFAEGAAPGTPASAVSRIYAKADGLLYSKDDAGVETLMSSGPAGGASDLIMRRYVRSGANYSITGAGSNTFADIDATNLKWTITATGKPLLIVGMFACVVNNVAGSVAIDVDIDGTRLSGGAALGLSYADAAVANEIFTLPINILSTDLSAGSHTIAFQWRQGNTAHTAQILGVSVGGVGSSGGIVELYAV